MAPRQAAKVAKARLKLKSSLRAKSEVPVSPKIVFKKSPLTKSEVAKFREMLMEKRRSLIGDMTNMQDEALRTNRQDGSGDLSLMPDHPANIATDTFEQEFTLGLLESERTMLKEINEALERIAEGTFGVCMGTGEPIAKPRLMARPWAKYCIEYARMIEKGLIRPPEASNDIEPESDDEPLTAPVEDDDFEFDEEIPDNEE
ncbi:MAG: hypothetical protein EHM48_07635 [Planctomycetaceae bacterium]|nr:MAG: hypothetical protein EHM48_07635 [Planctomycetaceae bacterium]